MLRKSWSLIAIIAVILVSMATVTVLAQPRLLALSGNDPAATPIAAIPVEAATSQTESDPGVTPVMPATPSPTATTPAASTPADTDKPSAPPAIPTLEPFTLALPSAAGAPQAQVAAPLQLKVPAIGVDTTIEWVGLDEEGNMAVPSTYTTVAWYERGPNPGMKGNAVVAGHFDSKTGPAIFYRLGDLQPGDEITVVAHGGEELRFTVTGVEAFDADSVPLFNVFGPASTANLNLVTCAGSFDPASRQYDKRLVVYSTLVTD